MDQPIGMEENSVCNRDGCPGKMDWVRGGDGDCSCHISPPCSNCVDSTLECPVCGADADDDL